MKHERRRTSALMPENYAIGGSHNNFTDAFAEIERLARAGKIIGVFFQVGATPVDKAAYLLLDSDEAIKQAHSDCELGFQQYGNFQVITHEQKRVSDTGNQAHLLVATVFCT